MCFLRDCHSPRCCSTILMSQPPCFTEKMGFNTYLAFITCYVDVTKCMIRGNVRGKGLFYNLTVLWRGGHDNGQGHGNLWQSVSISVVQKQRAQGERELKIITSRPDPRHLLLFNSIHLFNGSTPSQDHTTR